MTAGPSSRLARLPIFYGWIIVAAAFGAANNQIAAAHRALEDA